MRCNILALVSVSRKLLMSEGNSDRSKEQSLLVTLHRYRSHSRAVISEQRIPLYLYQYELGTAVVRFTLGLVQNSQTLARTSTASPWKDQFQPWTRPSSMTRRISCLWQSNLLSTVVLGDPFTVSWRMRPAPLQTDYLVITRSWWHIYCTHAMPW
jgi:hypothetical protein